MLDDARPGTRMWQRLGVLAFWLTWPGLWLYLRRTTRTRLLLRVGDEILVTRTWLSDGRWSLPGGGLHRGEEPVSGVIRETGEETGVVFGPEAIRPLAVAMFRYHGLRFLCRYFVADLSVKPAIKLQHFEISDSRWVKVDQISPTYCGPDVIEAIGALSDDRKPRVKR